MTYWALNAFFLGAILIVVIAAALARRTPRWRAAALTAFVLLVMTAIFDNVMIAVGLVGYDPARISGAKLGIAPLEDFSYAIAAIVLLPVLWHLLPRRTSRSASDSVRGRSGPVMAPKPSEDGASATPQQKKTGEGES
ncbi:lycopene cyclase domain-containing protein [Schumannella luteola]|uniref:Lycopene cyclase domain-containing protein n=1 Tax=Schumannella luteola TaxID=472059 RepID=A0A852Y5G9_9MICO|nr:lycopene cyclase domain-containing protein [Schumannella luteola]NYG98176.1 lycopene cyclase domain-containing protein [Schumannella luteola]TPX01889.1 lycopene cyclase domain-containing protein [Schumannella luteola]